MVNEEWMLICGWPYEVSSEGRVRNTRTGRELRQSMHKSGYMQLQLWKQQSFKTCMVHVLVCEAFHGARPDGDYEAAHLNGRRVENNKGNLAWKTPKENIADRELHGMTARGQRNGKTRYAPELIVRVRQLRRDGKTCVAVAAETGISSGYVHRLSSDAKTRRDADVEGVKVPWREYLGIEDTKP